MIFFIGWRVVGVLQVFSISVKVTNPNNNDNNNNNNNFSLSLDNRDEKVAAVYEEIERDMVLIGATAIEDKCVTVVGSNGGVG